MSICVTNEIGALKKVIVHRPGIELEHLVPEELERLLFDDIPFLKTAQKEHDVFVDILRNQGAEVCYLADLAAETLKLDRTLRDRFIDDIICEGGSIAEGYKDQIKELLENIEDEKRLVLKAMAGISVGELPKRIENPLVDLAGSDRRFALDPMPNLYFTRDPFASMGRGICLNHMYSNIRRRETIFGRYIFEYHPEYHLTPMYYKRHYPFNIEGGDILNLSTSVIAVGLSQRTSPEAVELLASNIFNDNQSEIKTILALDIPNMRAFMHLDTVLTQVDYDKFTIHSGIKDALRVYEITQKKPGRIHVEELQEDLAVVLGGKMGIDKVTFIRCGGKDRVASEREQWNDGSNTLCVSPGRIIVYDRNYVTNAILRDNGIETLEMPGSELSRGRGGPRCMSMPLQRAQI